MENENLKPIQYAQNMKPKFFSIGALPTSYINSLSYEEQLIDLYRYIQNSLVPIINNNAGASEELQTEFLKLQSNVNTDIENQNNLINNFINGSYDKLKQSQMKCGLVLTTHQNSLLTRCLTVLNGTNKLKTINIEYDFKTLMTPQDYNEILNNINNIIINENNNKYILIDNVKYDINQFTHLIIDMPFNENINNNQIALNWSTNLIMPLSQIFENIETYFIPYYSGAFPTSENKDITKPIIQTIFSNIDELYNNINLNYGQFYIMYEMFIASLWQDNFLNSIPVLNALTDFLVNKLETLKLPPITIMGTNQFNETHPIAIISYNNKFISFNITKYLQLNYAVQLRGNKVGTHINQIVGNIENNTNQCLPLLFYRTDEIYSNTFGLSQETIMQGIIRMNDINNIWTFIQRIGKDISSNYPNPGAWEAKNFRYKNFYIYPNATFKLATSD